jgi:protein phosphatase
MAPLRAAGRSDLGLVRPGNEDAWLVDPAAGLYVVADGLGGHPGGEVAARLAVERLPPLLRDAPFDPWTLRAALVALNAQLADHARRYPELDGMGTTVVTALVCGDRAAIGHVGDSRAYQHRQGRLARLTKDHSVVEELLDAGSIDQAQAVVHPQRSQLTQCVGACGPVVPSVRTVELAAGDRLLLCTDGLTTMLEDAAIERLLARHADPDAACTALIDAALAAGGLDNVTVVVVDVE